MSDVTERIECFINYFVDQVRAIENAQDSLHTRILWITLLDAVSQAANPSLGRKNHQRITRFLENTACWEIRDRCSLPQIKLNLEDRKLSHGKLYEFVTSELAQWDPDSTYEPEQEPLPSSYSHLAYCDCERKIIAQCSFKELFYSYRNWLVHGYKIPGYGIDRTRNRKKPYYQTTYQGVSFNWELIFPAILFKNLVSVGLENLKQKLLDDRRDPYDAYEFGAKW